MRSYKRRNYFINKQFQSKYILLTILLLLAYTFLFVIILFLPYIIPLQFDYPLDEQIRAAKMLLSLHKSVWPAIGAVIVVMSVLSIFITHKVAGPVYRLQKALAEISAGNLAFTIRLRKYDDLQDLAGDLNLVVEELRAFVKVMKADEQTLSACLGELEARLAAGTSDEATRELLASMQASRQSMARALARYSVS